MTVMKRIVFFIFGFVTVRDETEDREEEDRSSNRNKQKSEKLYFCVQKRLKHESDASVT